jgi:hypothetical protein
VKGFKEIMGCLAGLATVHQLVIIFHLLHLLSFETPVIYLLIFLIFHLQFVEYYKLILNV